MQGGGNVPDASNMQGKHVVCFTPLVFVGLGCFYAWFILAQYMMATSARDMSVFFSNRLVFDLALPVLFVFAFFLSRFIYPIYKRLQPPLLPLAFVGMFLVAYNPVFGDFGLLVCLFGAACIGLQYAWLGLIWVELFGLLEPPRTLYKMGFSVLAAGLILALGFALPRNVLVVFAAALPVLSTIMLALAFRLLKDKDIHLGTKLQRFEKPDVFRPVAMLEANAGLFQLVKEASVTFAIYGFIYTFASMYGASVEAEVAGTQLRALGFSSAGVILLVAIFLSRKRLSLSRLYWALQPVLVLGLLLTAEHTSWSLGLINFGYVLLLLLCTLTICEMGRRFEQPCFYIAIFVFGIGSAFCCLGVVAGYVTSLVLPNGAQAQVYVSWALVVILVIYSAVSSRNGGFCLNIKLDSQASDNIVEENELADPHNMSLSRAVYHEALHQRCLAFGQGFGLTQRETEILVLVAQNHSTAEIAAGLALSHSTVKVHIHNILKKFDLHHRSDLAKLVHSDQGSAD
jgi:DNA-binding CsgD family transcriptional regulator